MPSNDGIGDIIKCLRAPRSDIEYAAALCIVEEPQVDCGDVVNINKVPLLFPVRITVATLEQAHLTVFAKLLIKVKRDAGHRALVLLAGTVNIEVTKADDLLSGLETQPAHVLIEQ